MHHCCIQFIFLYDGKAPVVLVTLSQVQYFQCKLGFSMCLCGLFLHKCSHAYRSLLVPCVLLVCYIFLFYQEKNVSLSSFFCFLVPLSPSCLSFFFQFFFSSFTLKVSFAVFYFLFPPLWLYPSSSSVSPVAHLTVITNHTYLLHLLAPLLGTVQV